MVSRLIDMLRGGNRELDCPRVRELSSDYIDGELDQPRAKKVRSHLDWCRPCRAFVNTLRATVNLLRATPKSQAPDDLRQRIRDRTRL